MKRKTVYYCEICEKNGKSFSDEDANIVEQHEAKHYRLTIEEMHKWEELKRDAAYAGSVVSRTKNQLTDNVCDIACEKLTEFEIKHHLT